MWKLILKKLGKYLGKYFLTAFSGNIKNLQVITKALNFESPKALLKAFQKEPQKIVNALDKLGTKGRRALATQTGFTDSINTDVKNEKHDFGDIEEKHLSSSWQFWGKFEYTNSTTGTLWLQTKYSPKEYICPNFPAHLWELMKAAKGENGSGSGTVWWQWYRKFRKTATAKAMRLAFAN